MKVRLTETLYTPGTPPVPQARTAMPASSVVWRGLSCRVEMVSPVIGYQVACCRYMCVLNLLYMCVLMLEFVVEGVLHAEDEMFFFCPLHWLAGRLLPAYLVA